VQKAIYGVEYDLTVDQAEYDNELSRPAGHSPPPPSVKAVLEWQHKAMLERPRFAKRQRGVKYAYTFDTVDKALRLSDLWSGHALALYKSHLCLGPVLVDLIRYIKDALKVANSLHQQLRRVLFESYSDAIDEARRGADVVPDLVPPEPPPQPQQQQPDQQQQQQQQLLPPLQLRSVAKMTKLDLTDPAFIVGLASVAPHLRSRGKATPTIAQPAANIDHDDDNECRGGRERR